MKSLPIASLALVLALSGCASDKFYELGYEIGTSRDFVEGWAVVSKEQEEAGRYTFKEWCETKYQAYLRQTNDESFALPTSEELESLLKGCGDGYTDATRR